MAGLYSYDEPSTLIPKEDIELLEKIGHGAFSTVYKGIRKNYSWPASRTTVAIKILKNKPRLFSEAIEEISKLLTLNHPNIIELYGVVNQGDSPPWIILEYISGGSLLELVKNNYVDDDKLIGYMQNVASGMVYLHSKNILHKDLAARNILLDKTVAKVADFGVSSLIPDQNDNGEYYQLDRSMPRGNKKYPGSMPAIRARAVECYEEGICTKQTDVWGFGVLMWEVWSNGEKPYSNDKTEVGDLIQNKYTPLDISEPTCPPDILELMQTVLNTNRRSRPTFIEVLATLDEIITRRHHRANVSVYRTNPSHLQMESRYDRPRYSYHSSPPRTSSEETSSGETWGGGLALGLGLFAAAGAALYLATRSDDDEGGANGKSDDRNRRKKY